MNILRKYENIMLRGSKSWKKVHKIVFGVYTTVHKYNYDRVYNPLLVSETIIRVEIPQMFYFLIL